MGSEPTAPEPSPPADLTAPAVYVAAGLQPVRFGEPDRVVLQGALQGWVNRVVGLEGTFTARITRLRGGRAAPSIVPVFTSPIAEPLWQADGRVHGRFIHGVAHMAGRDVPVWAGLNAGLGVVRTQDDRRASECDNRAGDPCTLNASQVHLTPVVGATMGLAVSPAARIRVGVSWNTWRETYGDDIQQRLSVTTVTLGVGSTFPRRRPRPPNPPDDEPPFDG